MAAARNPKFVFNAYKNNCNNKVKKIVEFIAANAGGLDTKKVLKLEELNKALKDQFARMELDWDASMKEITDSTTFEELEKVVKETQTAVDKTLEFRRGLHVGDVQESCQHHCAHRHRTEWVTLRQRGAHFLWLLEYGTPEDRPSLLLCPPIMKNVSEQRREAQRFEDTLDQ